MAFYIYQWCRHFPTAPNIHSQLAEDTETAHLVYRIQDRLSALGISTATNVPALIEQTVIFQEMMRPSVIQAEKAPAQEIEITPSAAGISFRNKSPAQNEHLAVISNDPKVSEPKGDGSITDSMEQMKGHESEKGKIIMDDDKPPVMSKKETMEERLRALGVTLG